MHGLIHVACKLGSDLPESPDDTFRPPEVAGIFRDDVETARACTTINCLHCAPRRFQHST